MGVNVLAKTSHVTIILILQRHDIPRGILTNLMLLGEDIHVCQNVMKKCGLNLIKKQEELQVISSQFSMT